METSRAERVKALLAASFQGEVAKVEGQSDREKIANSNKTTEHLYGNALDIYPTDVTSGNIIAHYLDDHRDEYQIATLCYDPGIGRKFDVCTTKHTDHIHVDFGPKCGGNVPTTGTPQQRATACEQYQNGKAGPATGAGELGGIGDMFGLDAISATLEKGLLVGLGVVVVVAGLALLLKDSAVVKGATKAITKGVI